MIHASAYPSIAIPADPLPTVFLDACARHGDAQALVCASSGQVIRYAELAARVQSLAASLRSEGLRAGDVVALAAGNSVDYPIILQGALLAGAVVTPVNPLCTPEEMRRQLRDAGARRVIFSGAAAERVREACAGLPVSAFHEIGTPAVDAMQRAPVPGSLACTSSPDDLAVLPYSSGTSGLPKGVMLTHGNLVANTQQALATFSTDQKETVLGVIPFFHIYGMLLVMTVTLLRGDRLVVASQPADLVATMERHRVSRAYLVPPLVLMLARSPVVDAHDLSSLREVVCGAAPLDAAVADELAARLGCEVSQGYGMTETSPVVANGASLSGAAKSRTVGTLVPHTQARFVDPDTLEDMSQHQPGEILIRGPQVMKGYLNRPEETASALLPQGWLRTGDVGRIDADGNLHIVDRIKELIKYKGYQIAPSELEGHLLQHPCVRDAAVIPVPDAEAGEVPKAFIVLKPQAQATADELMAFVTARVAPYKKVRRVEVVDAIPKSPSGKILRRVLVELERERAGQPQATPTCRR